ncbi:MAG: 16S rRNA (cytosine(1402)-N(4))-methyltransferase RsmH [Candidatus Caldatribacteriaceae bacterium]
MVISLLHRPVMVEEVCCWLITNPLGIYVDATLGCGGHALAILRQLQKGGKLIGIDRDPEALRKAGEVLREFTERVILVHSPFSSMSEVLGSLGVSEVSGILFDLGVSSLHLDQAERGFSFEKDGPLDMRMDTTQKMNASWVVNHFSERELADLIYQYGEERYARRIARAIVEKRKEEFINSTRQLAQIVEMVVPRREKIHPATRTFMALRIFVNRELEELTLVLSQVPRLLERGGRVAILSYHSLEDRIVKRFLKDCSELMACTKKPLRPSREEITRNPRARSARLRVAERVAG